MRGAILFLATGLLAAAPASARIALGQYGRWGAFRDPPARCFAASEPTGGGWGGSRPFLAVSLTHGGGTPRVHVAPSRTPGPARPLVLEIGDRRFTLAGPGGADARIIAAIRRAERLRVAGVDARGRRFHDDYPLAGAPSAIDAAIVGCL